MTKEDLRCVMGRNIRNERLKRSMSIEDMAEILELTPGFLGLIERGRRGATAYNLLKISQVFDITIDGLFELNSHDTVNESEKSKTESLREKIHSMVYGLTGKEMFFIVGVIKGIREMYYYYKPDDYEEE